MEAAFFVILTHVKGSLTRDFRLQVFFINKCPLPPVTMTSAINLLPVTTTPLIRVCGVSIWARLFMAVRMKLSAAVSDFGGQSY